MAALRAQGRAIQSGAQPVDKARSVSTSTGQLLTTALASAGVSTAVAASVTAVSQITQGQVGPQGPQGPQGAQGVVGPQGPAGQNALDVSSFEVDASGNLIVMFGDSSTVNLGSVAGPQGVAGPPGPAPNLSIGTVTLAAVSAVTITGTNPNYVLNFALSSGGGFEQTFLLMGA